MTDLADPPVLTVPETAASHRPSAGQVAEGAALAVAVLVWSRYVTAGQGGRDTGRLVIGLLSLLPALVATRSWRLPPAILGGALLMPVATLLVCLVTPYGWAGGQVAAAWTYAAGALVVVAAFARTAARRQAVVVVIALVSLDQFAQSFLAWWGGRDPSRPMVGSFYWHNQFAAFLVPGALIAASLTTLVRGPASRLGWVVTPLCVSGIIFSTSRATMGITFVGLLMLASVALRAPDRRRAVIRLVALCLLSAATASFFTTSAFFPGGSGSAFSALEKRSQAESLGGNSAYRKQYMTAALSELADRPVAGAGFTSFGAASQSHLPPGSKLSPAAHSGLLQMYAEGGVLAGFPLTVLLGCLAFGAWRRLRAGRSGHEFGVTVAVVVATGGLMAHALIDFDWSYPALLAMAGVLAGVLLALPSGESRQRVLPPWQGRAALATLAAVVAGTVGVSHNWDSAQNAVVRSQGQHTPAAAAAVLAAGRGVLPDTRLDAQVLTVALQEGLAGGLQLPVPLVRTAVRNTEGMARVDDNVSVLRDGALYLLGDKAEALASSRAKARVASAYNVNVVSSYAVLLDAEGRRAQARQVLAREIVQRAAAGYLNGAQLVSLLAYLNSLGDDPATVGCAADALRASRPSLLAEINVASRAAAGAATCAALAHEPVAS